ncbi:MAG: phosphoadenylyl-sulfate reductase [Pseudomonadota bacterium]
MRLDATATPAAQPSQSPVSARSASASIASFATLPAPHRPEDRAARASETWAKALSTAYEPLTAQERLARALDGDLPGPVALVSSFGADSVVLLHLAAEIDRSTPILFLETEMLFQETLDYQKRVADLLGLTDVRLIHPSSRELVAEDRDGALHLADQDACCDLRKRRPLERALGGFGASISGRKRHQSATRADIALVETDGPHRLKLNPLADWSAEDLADYRKAAGLPPHPLVAEGFLSIGCAPCTTAVSQDEDPRAGRWRGAEKTECGIHFENGRIVRRAG